MAKKKLHKQPTEMTRQMESIAVIYAIFCLIIPAYLTLQSIEAPVEPVYQEDPAAVTDSSVTKDSAKTKQEVRAKNVSPFGYTWSLSLFIFPVLANWTWLLFFFNERSTKDAFWLTIVVLVPIGYILDITWGNLFFNFPNRDAYLGIYLPGYDFEKNVWIQDIPIEEFIFYTSGFMLILTCYLTGDENWHELYNRYKYADEDELKIKEREGIIKNVHYPSLILGIILIVVAVLYKKYGAHEYNEGMPGYFIFIVIVALVPAFLFFNTAEPFINWRAFTGSLFYLLLISILWEATLASPYEWWRYNYDQMMGIVIEPWSDLPIEAAMVWLVISFTTVIVYNTIKIWLLSGKTFRKFFLG